MKKIHKLILKAYIGPLIVTFFIVMFVLMMNFVWRCRFSFKKGFFVLARILQLYRHGKNTN